jgi:GNAT superfamily N-acetyltransferase
MGNLMSASAVVSELIVEPVATRRQRREFLLFPWSLYSGDPNWIPPLLFDQRGLLGFHRHPFYQDGECQTFLAYRQGRPVGRVAAIVNHAHNRRHKEERGFFGFFESIDDQEVADSLFEAAQRWFVERNIRLIRGPCNPSLNYECGLLVEGFDTPPFFMMTYNKPYYGRLIEGTGFQKAQDLYAYWGHFDMLEKLDPKLLQICMQAAERFNVKVRPISKSRFREELDMFLNIYNQSLGATWGFVPLSPAEVRHLGSQMRHMIVPELSQVAEVDGQPIGVVFGLLDYNPRIKQIDGRLFPFGFIRLLSNRRALKRMRIISANVVPEYQRWGIGLVLLNALVPKVKEWGIEEAEFSWVLESNTLSRGGLEKGGAKLSKTYRIFDRD